MIKVTVIALGKLKEKYLRDASAEYQKRLSRYCNLNIVEIEPVKLSEKPSETEINTALQKEAEAIIKKIPSGNYVFSLCVEGKPLSSEEFAQKIGDLENNGKGITFVIGSSYGLHESIKNLSNFKLSLSKMTFPHQLFRIMLLEQIYRSFKINEGSTYHK